MEKQTKLDDSANIYQPRIEQTEKEKLKDMTFSKKLGYLWGYYKLHVLFFLAGAAFISYLIYTIVKPDIETILYAAVVNNTIEQTDIEELTEDFSEHLNSDPEAEKIILNPSFYLNGPIDYAMNMRQILVTYVAAQDVDIIIAPESEMESFAYNGFLSKMSDKLPTDLYSSLTESFYYSDTEDQPTKEVYGIYVSNSDFFINHADNEDPYILSIIGNSRRTDTAVEFIRYLFQLFP